MTHHHDVLDDPPRTVDGCWLCAIIRGEHGARFIHRYDDCIVVEHPEPQAPVHVLVAPTTHFATPTAFVSEAGSRVIGKLIRVAVDCGAQLAPRGFRLVTNQGHEAGQTISHVVVHVIGGRPLAWPPG